MRKTHERGFFATFYPIIILVLALPVGTEIGAWLAGFAADLGPPIVPFVYAPLAGAHWFAVGTSAGGSHAMKLAGEGFAYTVLACLGIVYGLMMNDMFRGRSWGPLNVVFIIVWLFANGDGMRGSPSHARTSSKTYHDEAHDDG